MTDEVNYSTSHGSQIAGRQTHHTNVQIIKLHVEHHSSMQIGISKLYKKVANKIGRITKYRQAYVRVKEAAFLSRLLACLQ